MKYLLPVVCILLGITTITGLMRSHHYQQSNAALTKHIREETNTIQAKQDVATSILATKEEMIQFLQTSLASTRSQLSNSDFQLRLANQQLADYQQKTEPTIAPPTVSGSGKGKTYTFPKVIGKNGGTLATAATFGGLYGRKLVFRFENLPAKSIDVDDLHPVILQHLGIDAEAAKNNQRDADAMWTAKVQSERVRLLDQQQREALEREANFKLAMEKSKADEESRLRIQAAETERIKAQAAARAADAAMIQATKPPDTTVIQNVNQNVR